MRVLGSITRLLNCVLYLDMLLTAVENFNTASTFDAGLTATICLWRVLTTGICVPLNTFNTVSCLVSCAGISIEWADFEPLFGTLRLVTQGSVQISEGSVLRLCPKSLKRGAIMPVKACNTVAVFRCISCRLRDITNDTLALAANVDCVNVSFSDTTSSLTKSQTAALFPNATHFALMSFTTSDTISV